MIKKIKQRMASLLVSFYVSKLVPKLSHALYIYIKILKKLEHIYWVNPCQDINIIHKSWYTNSRPRGI